MLGSIAVLDIQDTPDNKFKTLQARFGVQTAYIPTDISSKDSLVAGFNTAVEILGTIDGALTSAGIAIKKPFIKQTWKKVSRIQEINIYMSRLCSGLPPTGLHLSKVILQVLGTFFTTQLVTKQLLKQGTPGSIVHVASITAHTVLPKHRMTGYNTSKGAVRMLTEALRVEMAPHGIRVNSISPGLIDSEQLRAVRTQKSREDSRIYDEGPPLGRISNFNNLTSAVVYLLSNASAYTTASNIAITGGLYVGRINV
ncbi:putative short-chain dehydrogenase [Aspergillus brunneoviolaceus CBS 621.78]|uniref:Short-chain dehydrogenase n=1 Tax=Aspergillus brunneoviolaceus CBS 621.78 TaxID=1450534 RepID=A0ACD1GE07_9EURO|nr:putative short-chain dehydrogenase [Aspergillus brunneoviolaceus CBS 621.78]RAH47501.1 putative short-chain dehydrogenase [Aspergillus brunneoviolaceus CBS 621.78]